MNRGSEQVLNKKKKKSRCLLLKQQTATDNIVWVSPIKMRGYCPRNTNAEIPAVNL